MTGTKGRSTEMPAYRGFCKGGPFDGRHLVYEKPTRMFGDWMNSPTNHVVAGEPELPPAKMVVNPTGYYSWSYTEDRWDWYGRT